MDSRRKINLKFIIIAIVCSVLLWCYVIAQLQISGANSNVVTLNYYNTENGLNVTGATSVQVTVWGSQSKLTPNDITAYVDLAGLNEGVYELPVEILPIRGAVLTRIEPSEVQVTLEKNSRRNLSVSCDVLSAPPEGYHLTHTILSPENCIVKGNEDALNDINRVVARLDLSSVTNVQDLTVPLVALDFSGNVIENVMIIPSEIDVSVLVEVQRNSKTVPVTCNISGIPAGGASFSDYSIVPSQVTIYGTSSEVSDIMYINAGTVSLSDHDGSFSRILTISGTNGITVFPSEVQINVNIYPVTGLIMDEHELESSNIPEMQHMDDNNLVLPKNSNENEIIQDEDANNENANESSHENKNDIVNDENEEEKGIEKNILNN